MRILHISGDMRIGGAERALFQVIRAQRASGDEADLLLAKTPSFYAEQSAAVGAQVYSLNQRGGFDLTVAARFREIATKYEYVHFHTPNPALFFAASSLTRQRVYYTHRAGRHKYPLKRKVSYLVSGCFVRKRFRISANTRHGAVAASMLFKIPLRDIFVTYNGMDFSLLEPRISCKDARRELKLADSTRVLVATSGNLRPLKRVEILVEAMSRIDDQTVSCVVLGDGPVRDKLEALAAKHRVSHRVVFPGQKAQIGDYLQLVDMFVLPSDESESFGNSAVEAMGLGIPTIVMNDGGGLLEHMTDGGGFVVESTDELATILKRLVKDVDLRRQIGKSGSDYVRQKYSVDAMVQSYREFYTAG